MTFYFIHLAKNFFHNCLVFCEGNLLQIVTFRVIISETIQTSKMDLFDKIVDGFQPLTIFAKSSI